MARGINTAVDSVDFFVQHTAGQDTRDAASVLSILATATGTGTAADQINTIHKGAWLLLNIASISVNTATLAVNVNAKIAGNYCNIARLSVDGITNGNVSSQQGIMVMYPGAIAPTNPTGIVAAGVPLPGRMQVTASLTITTTASHSGVVSYSVSQSRVL